MPRGGSSVDTIVNEAFLLSQRAARRATLAHQGEKMASAIEHLKDCRSEEEFFILVEEIKAAAVRFRQLQSEGCPVLAVEAERCING